MATGRSIERAAAHSGEPQTKGMTRISCSAARRTSWSKPSKSGSETKGVSGWIPAQYIGSLTLGTSLLSISAKSRSSVGPCGAMPANAGGRLGGGRGLGDGEQSQAGGGEDDGERAFHRWGVTRWSLR